ncbi:MAG: N-acetyl-gamma-glutamyl-phosphate reductase [Verrucomicrobiales bacterium]|nr:N-acetyl-gamma-glutamyl-phosphate reductase [Verrucomicrobiales bacterium]
MSEKKIKVAIVGASGYSGKELLRLLLMHENVDLVCATSRQSAGQKVSEVFPRFRGGKAEDLVFVQPDIDVIAASGAQCAFLALPHGVAVDFAEDLVEKGLRVIDLSADFRLEDTAVYLEYYDKEHPSPELMKEAVYGLPEVYAEEIKPARLVASPGCYPTSIILPLIPVLKAGLIDVDSITVSSISGASGAGKKADTSLLFVEINESVRAYGAPKHRHLSEIEQELSHAAGQTLQLTFIPHLMPVTAGIHSTTFATLSESGNSKAVSDALTEAYTDSSFVRLLGEGVFPDTKNVVGTNFIDIGWVIDQRTGRLVLFSAEDNLGKGASSQALQSFNLMFDLPEKAGLLHF